jgi:hypothetical protein
MKFVGEPLAPVLAPLIALLAWGFRVFGLGGVVDVILGSCRGVPGGIVRMSNHKMLLAAAENDVEYPYPCSGAKRPTARPSNPVRPCRR